MSKENRNSFYNSKKWRDCRNAYFNSKYGICELCGKPGEEVHHKVFLNSENIHDYNIAFNWDNLQLLCRGCHNAIHEKAYDMYRAKNRTNAGVKNGLCFDEDGNIIENKNVFIVWGAPASGKTTYVRENKGKYDLVVDLDYILSAISFINGKDRAEDYLPFGLEIRDLLYNLIAERKYYFEKAWIIATLPNKKKRLELQSKLKAELIHIDTSKDLCLKRARNDEDRRNKDLQYKIIEKYFKELEI